MKKILIFSFLLFSLNSFSQKYVQLEELLDNNWHLINMVVENVDYLPPNNNEISYISADFSFSDLIDFETKACGDYLYGSLTPNYEGDPNSQFITWGPGEWMEGKIECKKSDNQTYKQSYYNFYKLHINQEVFNFTITNESDGNKILTITNKAGDKVIYSNAPLSINELSINKIQISPNPVRERLIIQNTDSKKLNIKINDVNGKQLFSKKLNSDKSEIYFTNYPKGIYFISFELEGKIIKTEKIIKK